MKKYIIYAAGFFLLVMNSCSSPAEELAGELCDCLKESGLKGELSNGIAFNKIENSPCANNFSEELYNHLKNMNNENRGKFLHEFSKCILDTDCAEIMYQNLPYDQLLKSMERTIERRRKKSNGFSFLNKPTICDCVNQKYEGDEATRQACKEMEKEWKEKYANASESERDDLRNEILDCEKVK